MNIDEFLRCKASAQPMSILVPGGTGFINPHQLRYAVARWLAIGVLDDFNAVGPDHCLTMGAIRWVFISALTLGRSRLG